MSPHSSCFTIITHVSPNHQDRYPRPVHRVDANVCTLQRLGSSLLATSPSTLTAALVPRPQSLGTIVSPLAQLIMHRHVCLVFFRFPFVNLADITSRFPIAFRHIPMVTRIHLASPSPLCIASTCIPRNRLSISYPLYSTLLFVHAGRHD